jgi:excisionase family DNA binding protein
MNNGSILNKLITPEELAEILNMSKASVHRLVSKRVLPFYKIGGSLRFKVSDIESYLKDAKFEPIIKCK